jgi:L,D-transpeptidase YcbB
MVQALVNPDVKDMARDAVLSDAMLGYLQFVSGVSATKGSWLYSSVPYAIAEPPATLVNNWQLSVRDGRLATFVQSLAPSHPQYAAMHKALKDLLADYSSLANRQRWSKLKTRRFEPRYACSA